MRGLAAVVLAAAVGLGAAGEGDSVLADTDAGRLEGERVVTDDGFHYIAFKGVPFAKPPLRELRFKRPEAVVPWSGLRSARSWAPRCVQNYIHGAFYPRGLPESEDCLFLNVFSPEGKTGLPVLFWVHGGGFSAGCAMEYPDVTNLLRKDVVVVSIQYRLGVYGFLAPSPLSGNWGLWDASAALGWVSRNIGAFGGDAGRVTVVGESAGAAIASLLSVSPHSRDHFQQLILMSGTHEAPWALSSAVTQGSEWLSRQVGCDLPSPAQSTDCLRAISTQQMQEGLDKQTGAESVALGYFPGTKMIFLPTMDGDFLPGDSLEELLNVAPKKPTLIGTTKDEVGFFVVPPIDLVQTAWTVKDPSQFSFHQFRDLLRDLIPDRKTANASAIRGAALKYYIYDKGDKKDAKFLIRQFMQLLNDVLMFVPTLVDGRRRSAAGWPVWLYSFDHFSPAQFPPNHEFQGAFHGSELTFLFEQTLFGKHDFGAADVAAAETLVRHWTDFVKTGALPWARLSGVESPLEVLGSSSASVPSSYAALSSAGFWATATGSLDVVLRPPYGQSGEALREQDEFGNYHHDEL